MKFERDNTGSVAYSAAYAGCAKHSFDHVGSVFLRKILERMKALGINQSELARRMNVSRPYISKVLRQDVSFTFATAMKLAHALEMDFFPTLVPRAKTAADDRRSGEV